MSGLGIDEAVLVKSGGGGLPTAFMWRGRRHVVRLVEACRPAPRRGGETAAVRHLYTVRTVEGMRCRLSHDAGRSVWRLESLLAGSGGGNERRHALV